MVEEVEEYDFLRQKAKELFADYDVDHKGYLEKEDLERLPGMTPDKVDEIFNILNVGNVGKLTEDEFSRCFNDAQNNLDVTESPEYQSNQFHAYPDHHRPSSAFIDDDLLDEKLRDAIQQFPDMYSEAEKIRQCLTTSRGDRRNTIMDELATTFTDVLNKLGQERAREMQDMQEKHRQQIYEHDRRMVELTRDLEERIVKEEEQKRIFIEKERQTTARIEEELEQKELEMERLKADVTELQQIKEELGSTSRDDEEKAELLLELEARQRIAAELEDEIVHLRTENVKAQEEARAHFDELKEAERREIESLQEDLQIMTEAKEKAQRDLEDEYRSSRERQPSLEDELLPGRKNSVLSKYWPRQSMEDIPETDVFREDDEEVPGEMPGFSSRPVSTSSNDSVGVRLPRQRSRRSSERSDSIAGERVPPVGSCDVTNTPVLSTPDRFFKIVFVGDSGVGKSSFVQRFCNDDFTLNKLATTIGVDFYSQAVKLPENGSTVMLQLWDTAGQERFRSITKQYFRKSDGIIVMYDVTSESSFTNVREWVSSVKEAAEPDSVLAIVANKLDQPAKRVVLRSDGESIAKSIDAEYYEVSACSGDGINYSMQQLAARLCHSQQQQLDRHRNPGVRIDKKTKSGSCC